VLGLELELGLDLGLELGLGSKDMKVRVPRPMIDFLGRGRIYEGP
jgi:hypothetical protein